MKKNLFICVLFFTLCGTAQDSLYCYNSGNRAGQNNALTETEVSAFTIENPLILMPFVMKEKEVKIILNEKNNSEINQLLKKVKLAKTFENIGFAAIPEALIGGGLIGAASFSKKGNVTQKSIGLGLLALSGVCLSSSFCFKIMRTKNYKKAIAKYNQLYN
jgi:hypothetical protein